MVHHFNAESEYRKLQFKLHSFDHAKRILFPFCLLIIVVSIIYFTYASYTISGTYNVTNATVASFTQKTYTINLDANGGSVTPTTISVPNNSAYGTLPTPVWVGHTFNGWFTATTGGTQVTSATVYQKSEGNITIHAQWTQATYTITYNGNGGTPSSSTQNITYGATYGTLPTVTKSYYSFVGWFTAQVGGTQITSTSTYTTEGNQTLYAHYTGTHYSLDYNPDYNTYGINSSSGARITSLNLTIKDENGTTLYTSNGISDYCDAQGLYNGTYYFTNVTYKAGCSYSSYTLRNDANQGASNLAMDSVGTNGSSFTFKHSTPGTMWFSINTQCPAAYAFNSGTYNTTYLSGFSNTSISNNNITLTQYVSANGSSCSDAACCESATGTATSNSNVNMSVFNYITFSGSNTYSVPYSGSTSYSIKLNGVAVALNTRTSLSSLGIDKNSVSIALSVSITNCIPWTNWYSGSGTLSIGSIYLES